MTPEEQYAKLERQRDAALIVAMSLMLGGLLLLTLVAVQMWN
jgi:hypothetical protein